MMNVVFYVLIVYLILNLLALLLYGVDKKRAQNNQYRISEKALLIAALFGPFGAYAGMKKYRHKTQKLKFKLVYIFMVLHIIIVALIVLKFF